jgi:DNA-binding MarR family transcriptional regulator
MTEKSERQAPEDAPATSVLFDVFVLGQAVRRFLDEAMDGSPLTPEEYAFYSAIFEPEQITPTALAARLGMPLTTVMDRLSRVEARGHAHRFPDPDDRRASLITLTAEGLAVHREANRSFERAYAAFVAELPDGETAAKANLARIRDAVERARTVPSVTT